MPNRTLSLAPMMDYTDRHDRFLVRLICKNIWLFTEMVTTNTLLHTAPDRFLAHHDSEHPVAIQLGGSNPQDLARCASISEQAGFDEVNLNVGCPSDRVKAGRFGAALMATPNLVADCVKTMQRDISIPVTVKCRIGIDDHDDYAHLEQFVQQVSDVGCSIFYIHARKAWLEGLSPKENRNVPPLVYDSVYRIKQQFPQLTIVVNGGIKTLADVTQHLTSVDGCMIGRECYDNPYFLADADKLLFQSVQPAPSRLDVLSQYIDYVDNEMRLGTKFTLMSRHILGLFQGVPGAKAWRRYISENAHKSGANSEVLIQAAKYIR